MSKSEMIPENVKMDLRSVLVAASGTCQSKLEREYKDMMGETLPVRELGFKNIYELLLALEGDVCRMEFSTKHCDNMVFAILENDKFSSGHAKKNANKSFSGIPHKTPEEIQMLSRGMPAPVNTKKSNRNNSNNNNYRSQRNRRFAAPNAAPLLPTPTKPMTLPTVSDWNKLNKLSCNNRGEFTLCGKVNNLSEADLRSLFKAFDPRYVRILKAQDGNRVGFVSFKSYMGAFIAWSHSLFNPKMVLLQIEPFANREINWLNSSCKLLIKNIPFGNIHMVGVVSLLGKNLNNELLIIETRVNNREAVAYYKTKEAAQEIIKTSPKMTNLEGKVFLLEFSIVSDPPKHSLAGVRSQINKNASGILPTPTQPPTQSPPLALQEIISPSKLLTDVKEEVSSPEKVENKYGDRRCGFPLNFTAAEEMFGVTNRRNARTSRNVADDITFLVTHYEDGCRFWIIVIDQEKNNFTKLMNLQSELNTVVSKMQPPSVKPKHASRGAALYYDEDSQKEVWYRCFVLNEGDEESDTFSVFFIDYGNVETIKTEQFRNTYPEFWKLPPQAIPCKLNGVDIKRGLSASQQFEARKELMDILSGQDLLMAQVVKDADYSQPHIIEVKNVRSAKTNDELNLDELCKLGLVCKIGDDNIDSKDNMEDSWNNIYDAPKQDDSDERTTKSMFQCDPNKLVFGMVSEIHNINLMYLLLGDFKNGIGRMESSLHKISLFAKESPSIKKGMTLLYNEDTVRRRVLVLNVDEINKKSKVLHVDYGHITWVNYSTLYQLDHNLCKQPIQARPAALAGIKCQSQTEATRFMKSYIKKLIRALIVRENDSGKLFVELFDDETGKSLNLELLESGLVAAENLIDQEDLCDETASLISVPKDGAPISGRIFDTRSFQTSGSSSSFSSRTDSEINVAMGTTEDSDERSANVKQWVESVSIQEESNEQQKEGRYRPHTPPCPPPDIVSSNTVKSSVKLSDGVRIEGRKVYLGYGEDIDELNLNSENKLIASEVESLREKWRGEKEILEKVCGSMQDMLHLTPDELKEKFKEKRKEKLILMVQMKKLQMELKKVETEYEKVVKETEALLAAV